MLVTLFYVGLGCAWAFPASPLSESLCLSTTDLDGSVALNSTLPFNMASSNVFPPDPWFYSPVASLRIKFHSYTGLVNRLGATRIISQVLDEAMRHDPRESMPQRVQFSDVITGTILVVRQTSRAGRLVTWAELAQSGLAFRVFYMHWESQGFFFLIEEYSGATWTKIGSGSLWKPWVQCRSSLL